MFLTKVLVRRRHSKFSNVQNNKLRWITERHYGHFKRTRISTTFRTPFKLSCLWDQKVPIYSGYNLYVEWKARELKEDVSEGRTVFIRLDMISCYIGNRFRDIVALLRNGLVLNQCHTPQSDIRCDIFIKINHLIFWSTCRNLSFESEEEDLEDKFEEFGELVYCRIVVDRNTERSRGSESLRFMSLWLFGLICNS